MGVLGVRLPAGEVTVVLGPEVVRGRLMALLDDDGPGVARVSASPDESVEARCERLRDAAAPLVLVDRLTDGLDALGRRGVLTAARALAAGGRTVLVDDVDSVAALAVADATLQADPVRGIVVDPLTGPAGAIEELYRAS